MRATSIDELRRQFAAADAPSLSRLIRLHSADPRAGVANLVESSRHRLVRLRTEDRRIDNLYRRETDLRSGGAVYVAGIDEVGRGALAGPVSAAACILPEYPRLEGLDDSKKLTPATREVLAARIHEVAICVSIAHVPADLVDALGMSRALRQAMTEALQGLHCAPDHVLLDGLPMGLCAAETSVIKGDSSVAAIAAASVVAKVSRDALMCSYAANYPQYEFEINKGYGTTEHLAAIRTHGPCPLHRVSFSGVRDDPTLF